MNVSLGQCIGICAGKNYQKYLTIIEQIIDIFSGINSSCLVEMEQLMEKYARNFTFEKAAKYRNYITALQSLLKQEKAIDFIKGAGKMAVFEKLNESTIKLFFIQGNRILNRKKISLTNKSELQKGINETILTIQKEKNKIIPSTVITKEDMDEAQIIYHYLQKGDCHYFQIADSWLEKEKIPLLEQKLKEAISVLSP